MLSDAMDMAMHEIADRIVDPPKQCPCCPRVFGRTSWRRLPLVGYQDDGDSSMIELRDCHCGSTIARRAM